MKKVLLIVFLIFFLVFIAFTSFVVSLYIDTNKDFQTLMSGSFFPVPTTVYDSSGKKIAIFGGQRRQVVSFDQISNNMKKAILAAEDARFYEHGPISFRAIGRALFEDIMHGRIVQGGSTITQQLVKNLYLTPSKTIYRKLKEAVLAYKIANHLTKNEILTLYLNTVYFGNGAYGIESASEIYFDKHASDLTIAESAMLAGLVQAPNAYNPYYHPELAAKRTIYVLNNMLENHFITKQQYLEAVNSKIVLAHQSEMTRYGYNPKAAYFIEYVRLWLINKYGEDVVNKGGLKVYTTIDMNMQRDAYNAVRSGILRLSGGKYNGLESALISIDPRNGYVKALVGGFDYQISQYNRAIQAKRQPGSAFKPIVYLTALEQGWKPTDTIADEPIEFKTGNKIWRPENYSHTFHGQVTLQYALAHSVNVATINLLSKVGVENVIANARKLGITEHIPDNLTIALGSFSTTLAQLTRAYCAFDNMGYLPKLIFITKIVDKNGNVIYEDKPELKNVFPQDVGYVLVKMMQDVIKEGTGVAAQALGRPAAGKTGTTNESRDNWFIGFTPQLVTGVWVGYDDNRSCGPTAVGATMALPIWLNYMQNALAGKPVENWQPPSNLPAWAQALYLNQNVTNATNSTNETLTNATNATNY
ncbi:MAG TPA: penicillin-binding protein 1A [Desulfurella acetivorans]|uniref:penicillin-binding protein 1A n=1 Tax=Desulfurella sp. TaxID=1962857 RepID=UPI001761DA39|nr:penicillin-binding protein 1A [Desulfurella acetivorans]